MKRRAATLLLLTYCLLFFASSYHFHAQEPQAALHCKVCAVSAAQILPPVTHIDVGTSSETKVIFSLSSLGRLDQLTYVSDRAPPLA